MSKAPAAKAAAFELINALDDDWHVTTGFVKSPRATWVCLDEIRWDYSQWETNRSRNEEFNIDLIVNVRRLRKTGAEIESEIMEIMGRIETAVNATHNLGVVDVISVGLRPASMHSYPSDDAIEGQFKAHIWVKARV